MSPAELVRAQLELECIGVDAERTLYRIPGENPDDIHRVFLVLHSEGTELFVRHDVDPSVAVQLRRTRAAIWWRDPTGIARLLYGSDGLPVGAWRGSTYCFTTPYPTDAFPSVTATPDGRFVVWLEGIEVSWAWSARANTRCAELATETAEAFRRRGFAIQVCRAWANTQLAQGRIPFYSHRSDNVPSAKLARALGVSHFMDCVSFP
ncbi:MAG: GNAT family N-acetyltransferase [Candidatus Bipolaricaulota bacterium]